MLDFERLITNFHEYVERAVAPLHARIKELEARQPERGEKGEPGPAGADAPPVEVADIIKELMTTDEIHSLVELRAKEAVAAIPAPKDGKDGRDGEKGERGERGERGEKGEAGADGLGMAGAMIDRDGLLIITTTKGETVRLGNVVGKDGRDGADFSEASLDYDGERGLIIKGRGGEIVKRLPIPIDRGYYRDGMSFEKGDIVTEGGSAWLALRDTKAKPGTEAKDDWRIFARKGRDGRDGKSASGPVSLK